VNGWPRRRLWGQAEEQGDALSQFNLGLCNSTGEGVKVDMSKAAQLYGRAGARYEDSAGATADKAQVAQLYGQAAAQGLAAAQYATTLSALPQLFPTR
jgi:TPR repeat protein